MNLHISIFPTSPILFTNIKNIYNDIVTSFMAHKVKRVKNNSITFEYNNNQEVLNKKNIVNDLLKTIKVLKIDLEEFKKSEKIIQISSTINKAIDNAQSSHASDPLFEGVIIEPIDKKEIFNQVQSYCNLKDACIDTNAAQTFIRQNLLSNKEVNRLIQSLTIKSINSNLDKDTLKNMSEDESDILTKKINNIRKDITIDVIEKLNTEVCKIFFSDINFSKISQYAAKVANDKLKNKKEYQIIYPNTPKITAG